MKLSEEQKKEIIAGKSVENLTRRSCVKALEEMLFEPFSALDHGFLRVVDYMGDDSAVVQAARVSYGRGTKKVSEDRGLIRYLMRHRHTTPFEMCEIKFHVKLPIFVARQWIRHRTASVNEYSARYSVMAKEFYLPNPEHLAAQSTQNAQGRGKILDPAEQAFILKILEEDALRCYQNYELMLNEGREEVTQDPERTGLARELARMNLTLNTYTEWYWKTNLHNLLHFVALRADPHAQYEIRVYADIMLKILEAWVPLTAEAFRDYRLGSVNLSAQQLKAVRAMLQGKTVTAEDVGLSKREWTELLAVLTK